MNKGQSDSVSKQTIAYYDSEAKVYDAARYQSARGQRAEAFHKRVLDLMLDNEVSPRERVLDLGCGTGRLLAHLAAKCHELCGMDLSQGMLELARQRIAGQQGAARVRLELGSVTAIPFSTDYFDAVYSILVINLIKEFREAFQEVARVLKPGGVFLFNVPNMASLCFPVGLYVNTRQKSVTANAAGYRYSHWFLPREWRAALNEAGFDVEHVKGQPIYARLVDGCAPLTASGLGLLLSISVYIKARLRG